MKLSLIVLTPGKQQGKALEIRLPQFLVGRDPQCQLRPASPLISKRHCAVLQRGGKAYIRDFDSTNGTFVNNERVQGERELHNDDQLKIGPIEFTVRIEQTSPVNRPTPLPPTKQAGPAQKPAKPAEKPASTDAVPAAKEPTASEEIEDTDTDTPALQETSAGATEDEDIAAMLLSLQDDSSASPSSEVPEGSTLFDLPAAPEPGKEEDKKENMLGKVKAEQENTSSAAKQLLEQYMKRPRT